MDFGQEYTYNYNRCHVKRTKIYHVHYECELFTVNFENANP